MARKNWTDPTMWKWYAAAVLLPLLAYRPYYAPLFATVFWTVAYVWVLALVSSPDGLIRHKIGSRFAV
jgi:hypothetical protein